MIEAANLKGFGMKRLRALKICKTKRDSFFQIVIA
jgi:hypothetical protein